MDIESIAREVLEPLGYELLEVISNVGRGSTTLTIRIDRLDEKPVAVEDLARASRVLGLELDRLDPIQGEYMLDLESPGPKRPLVTKRHFERMNGLKIKVKRLANTVMGKILEVSDTAVLLELDGGVQESVALEGIRANLAEWPNEHR
jgi:ribosome maturation factor RimP